MSVLVDVLRPGAARSRREADLWVEYTPCARCGGSVWTQARGGVDHEGTAVWEVLGRCRGCNAVKRALFDPGAGWTGGRTTPDDWDEVGASRGPMPLMAAGKAPSAILGPDHLRRMRDEQLALLVDDCPLDGPDRPDDDDWAGTVANAGRDLLEALYEIDLQAEAGRMTPDPGHAELKDRVGRMYRSLGMPLPDR